MGELLRARGRDAVHAGLAFTSDRSLPRSARGVAALAAALEALVRERGSAGFHGLTVWLAPPS